MKETTIFEFMYPTYKIKTPIRTIELFAGYGSTKLAWDYLGITTEGWKICEWAIKSIQAYKDIHYPNDKEDYSKDLTIDEVKEYLFKRGISSNYNEPMTQQQVGRLSEHQARTIYNNIIATHNLVNIQNVKGEDLNIVDKDKFTYVLSYSFPCQDISNAGKCLGYKDTSTRSGLLWEVERILSELKETDSLPQCLIMENVPLVHGIENLESWNKLQLRLEELGYKNYWEDLIATDYGIPQTRNRCFMVSLLGDYNYSFPVKQPLKLKLKDLLDENVDEKYFLSQKMINYIVASNEKWSGNNGESIINKDLASTINTCEGNRRCDASNYISDEREDNYNLKDEVIKTYDEYNHKINGADTIGTIQAGYPSTNHGHRLIIKNQVSVGRESKELYTDLEKQLFTDDGNIRRYIDSDIIDKFDEGQMATTTYPTGYGHGPRTHNESIALNTIDKPSVKYNLRIRKLTPNECFRLQGVKDEDYMRCAKHQSDSSLYHLAGDSICVDVLKAIYKEMI